MLSAQTPALSTLRGASAEVEASERLARGEVNLVSWHRELPSGLDAQLVEWAKRFPAQFDEIAGRFTARRRSKGPAESASC